MNARHCNEESEAVGSICSVLLRSVSKADRGRSTASRISQRTRIINVLPGLGRGRGQAGVKKESE